MLPALKRRIAESLLAAVDVAALTFSASGAAMVLFLGKLALSIVLAAVALGFFLRIVGRRQVKVRGPVAQPVWIRLASSVLAFIEVALLVEATNLPVRFDQSGFAYWHWGLVVVALAAAYSVHAQVFRSFVGKRRAAPQP